MFGRQLFERFHRLLVLPKLRGRNLRLGRGEVLTRFMD